MSLHRSRPLIVLALSVGLAGLAAATALALQAPAGRAAQQLTVISPDGRRTLPASPAGSQLMIALDEVSPLFGLTVREDAIAGGLTVTTREGKRILLTPGEPLASAGGRLVSLPAPLTRDGRRWLVPVEFLSRALAPVLGTRIEVRPGSRLVLIGDVRVPHIGVREQEMAGALRLTLSVAPRAGHQVVQEGNSLLLRFDATALDADLPAVSPGPLLQGMRLSEEPATIALALGPRFGSYRVAATTRGPNSEVIVDLVPAVAEEAAPAPAPAPAPAEPAPAIPGGPLPQLAAAPPSVRTVVIDAGHGGDELGAAGPGGVAEKEITLSIARRLRAALEARLGLRVVMTRDGDQTVSLDQRAAIANTQKADLFVSIHANASPRAGTRGAQVYYMAADEAGAEAQRAALARQSLPTLGGTSRDVELILWEMAQVRHVSESAAFAGMVEEELRPRLGVNQRPVLQAPFRVLAAANMPAVLVEVGYLTNREEGERLKTPAQQDRIAQAIFQAIVRFRQARQASGEIAVAPGQPPAAGPGGMQR